MTLGPDDVRAQLRRHMTESADVKRQVAERCHEAIGNVGRTIAEAFRAGGKLLLCGNGGSAADCQHMAAEMVGRLTKEMRRPGLPAIALTTDSSFLTAYANDEGYDGVFERQVQALGRQGDVLLGISTSGNSPNVILAVRAARALGMKTIVLTGEGGQLADFADVVIAVPSASTQYIQEAHLAIEHFLCGMVEAMLYGSAQEGRV